MGWLISDALMKAYANSRCSQEPEVESSEGSCSDGEQSAQSSGSHTQLAYLPQDRMTAFSRLSRFGMTFKPLTASLGEDLLTWYLEDSRARTYPAQDVAKESPEAGQACGGTWLESLAKYDPDSHSWRTPPCSLLGDSVPCSPTWPRWGMMHDGVAYRQQALVQTTRGIASGSLLPTPTCHNAKEGAYPAEYTRKTPTLATRVGGKIHPNFTEWMMVWPRDWTDLKPLETGSAHWQQHALLQS
jgi:hypothetical protein